MATLVMFMFVFWLTTDIKTNWRDWLFKVSSYWLMNGFHLFNSVHSRCASSVNITTHSMFSTYDPLLVAYAKVHIRNHCIIFSHSFRYVLHSRTSFGRSSQRFTIDLSFVRINPLLFNSCRPFSEHNLPMIINVFSILLTKPIIQ